MIWLFCGYLFGAGCMAIATIYLDIDLWLSAIAAAFWFILVPTSAFYLVVYSAGKTWVASDRSSRLERRRGLP